MSSTLGLGAAAERGRSAAWSALNGPTSSSSSSGGGGGSGAGNAESAPAWARNLRAEQTARHHRQLAYHSLKEGDRGGARSEEHTSELQSLMRISYAVFCLKKKKK